MTTTRTLGASCLCALLLSASACGSREREEEGHLAGHNDGEGHEEQGDRDHGDEPGGGAHAPGHGADESATVRVEPAMLRDLRITTAPVHARSGGEGATVLGELGPNLDAYAEVGCPVVGRVTRVLVAEGQRVEAGEPLVEVQSVELGRLRAELLAARARAELTAETAARKRSLAGERIVAPRELRAAEAEAASAEAEVRAASTALQAVQGAAGRAGGTSVLVLRAPIAGTVLSRDVALGRLVDPERTLLRIADLSVLWLTVHAFERDAMRVQVGASATVELPALPGHERSGTVAAIGQEVDPSSRTLPIRIRVDNADGALRPGMSATAWIGLGDASGAVLVVPAIALQRVRDGWAAFLPRAPGVFEVRPVGRGRDLGADVEVLSGLRQGETVVVEGAFLLKAEVDKASGEGGHDHD